jgi:hypothetical protein
MESFRQRFSKEEEVSVAQLAGTAMLIGVTNMKRRKLRTALTCVTIMLITFTMLSFTSVSQSMAPTRIRKEMEAPYNGLFFAGHTWGALPHSQVEMYSELTGQGGTLVKRGFVKYNAAEGQGAVLLHGDETQPATLSGILALELGEDGFLGRIPMVAGRYFNDLYAREVIVTDEFFTKTMGRSLEGENPLGEGIQVELDGVKLTVVGVVDSAKLATLKDLRGSSILPQELRQSGRKAEAAIGQEEEVPEGAFKDMDPQFYVLVPFGIREGFQIPLTSVSIKMPDAQAVWDRVLDFVHYADTKFYFGTTDRFIVIPGEEPVYELKGRYYLGSGFATSVGGLSSLIIPLLISATIIFNTMLGAVYERKKEIGIFNSIGLNPVHIALFFVAEAVVYGILGGVGGYLIGQVLSTLIVKLELLKGINLNYSSLSVVYVILATNVIVVISSIYPAIMAMKTASAASGRERPSKQSDNELYVQFPYSFTREMAIAVNSYLKEYFDMHADSSVGDFMAVPVRCESEGSDEDGTFTMRLTYDVALAPYDLGVTQMVHVTTTLNEKVGAYMVQAVTDRTSGQDGNWLATNEPFLNGIRKYLLHWRVLSREGQDAHLTSGLELFGLEAAQEASMA